MNATLSTAAVAGRRDDLAAWLVVTAPGMLLTRSLVTVALIATAWLNTADVDPRLLGAVAAGYLAVQATGTLSMVRRPGWVSTGLFDGGFDAVGHPP